MEYVVILHAADGDVRTAYPVQQQAGAIALLQSYLTEGKKASLVVDDGAGSEPPSTERVCANCQYWRHGCCDFIDTMQGEKLAATTGCQIVATAHDDSGLYVELRTGPGFSCPHFAR